MNKEHPLNKKSKSIRIARIRKLCMMNWPYNLEELEVEESQRSRFLSMLDSDDNQIVTLAIVMIRELKKLRPLRALNLWV